MPISDIAYILECDAEQLRGAISDEKSPAGMAYRRGKAASKVKLRTQEMQLAMVGSPLALENVAKNLIEMEDDE